eukprot:COSAG06_NODE_12300_length_1397_cov_8.824345_1_plen_78_part_10
MIRPQRRPARALADAHYHLQQARAKDIPGNKIFLSVRFLYIVPSLPWWNDAFFSQDDEREKTRGKFYRTWEIGSVAAP